MALVTCSRCGRTAEGLPFAPYPDEMGARILERVCAACWRDYMGRQTMVINEYKLDLMDPRAQEILTRDMIDFLNLEPEEGGAADAAEPEEREG